jgi:hypothetical protein
MPRRDVYHYQTKRALEKDGWIITHDPLHIVWEEKPYAVDLGAERIIAAERGNEKLAIEIKSFIGQSFSFDFYEALGQFDSYFFALAEIEPERVTILAISSIAFDKFFTKKHVARLLELKNIPVVVVDVENEIITQWIRYPNINK